MKSAHLRCVPSVASVDLVVDVAQIDAMVSFPNIAIRLVTELEGVHAVLGHGNGHLGPIGVLLVARVVVVQDLVVAGAWWELCQEDASAKTGPGLGGLNVLVVEDCLSILRARIVIEVAVVVVVTTESRDRWQKSLRNKEVNRVVNKNES